MQTSDIIISIRPEHAQNIMSGRKVVELRRRFPEGVAVGGLLLIYASSPERALMGAAFKEQACVPRELFNSYFEGAAEGFGVILGDAVRFNDSIPVTELKERFSFSPPQSYRYLRGSLVGLLNDERIQVPDRHEHRDRSRGQSASRRGAH